MPAKQKPQKPVKNQEYREAIIDHGCLCHAARKCFGFVICHHLNTGGTGTGGPDEFNTIPLCSGSHHTTGIHTMPERKFEEKYNLPHLRSLAIVFGVGYYGVKEGVLKLAEVR